MIIFCPAALALQLTHARRSLSASLFPNLRQCFVLSQQKSGNSSQSVSVCNYLAKKTRGKTWTLWSILDSTSRGFYCLCSPCLVLSPRDCRPNIWRITLLPSLTCTRISVQWSAGPAPITTTRDWMLSKISRGRVHFCSRQFRPGSLPLWSRRSRREMSLKFREKVLYNGPFCYRNINTTQTDVISATACS